MVWIWNANITDIGMRQRVSRISMQKKENSVNTIFAFYLHQYDEAHLWHWKSARFTNENRAPKAKEMNWVNICTATKRNQIIISRINMFDEIAGCFVGSVSFIVVYMHVWKLSAQLLLLRHGMRLTSIEPMEKCRFVF